MTTTLRIVLDQVVSPVDLDVSAASRELARALVRTAPSGCDVEAIVPASGTAPSADPAANAAPIESALPGLGGVTRLRLARRELAAAWQLGTRSGAGGGLIHSPTLMAPLTRHDRLHDHDQTVLTLWDLRAWEHPDELSRASVLWHRAMLKRAAKHADALVVPTHAAAERVADLARFGDRIRVVPGAGDPAVRIPSDDVGRRRALDLPDGFILLAGSSRPSDRAAVALKAIALLGSDLPVVVIGAPAGDEPAVADLAAAAGIAEQRLHVRGDLDPADRGAVFGGAVAFVAPSLHTHFPWRVVEALQLAVPIVAAGSAVHRDVIVDGGILVDDDGPDALGEALANALGSVGDVDRLGVLAGDRGRAFSWAGAAERVWQLHADL